MRRRTRDAMVAAHILERMVNDIRYLIFENDQTEDKADANTVYLWDNIKGIVANGVSYRANGDWQL